MVVEGLHPRRQQLLLHLPQVVVPQIGLLAVKYIEAAQSAAFQVLFQLLIGGSIRFSLWRHGIFSLFRSNGNSPRPVGAVDPAAVLGQPSQRLPGRVTVGIVSN